MTSPYLYRPRTIVQEYPILEEPARKLGLLEQEEFDAGVPVTGLARNLARCFADVVVNDTKPGATAPTTVVALDRMGDVPEGRSGVRFRGGKAQVYLEVQDGVNNGVDVLREFGCVVEMVTTQLLSMMRGQAEIVIRRKDSRGKGAQLSFKRQNTPSYALESAGFKFPDHTREYVNRHSAVLHAIALALLTKTDPRLVFLDVLEGAREDALMLKLLNALAFRSSVNFNDRAELEEYGNLYWALSQDDDSYYFNVQQVNDFASYYAGLLRDHVRNLAA